jgi:putative FmdB family regulatory protein
MAQYLHKCENEECELFDEVFSDRRPMSEYDADVECPQCKNITKKVIGQTAFQLKGAGWFNTGGYGANYKPVGNLMKRSDSSK